MLHREDKEFIDRMLKIISENISDSTVTTAFIAEEMGVSVRTLYNRLEGLINVTPNNIIKEFRLAYAEQLLSTTKLTIDEISRYAGYNPSYLYRQFIRQTSMAPIEYFNHLKINKATVYLLKTSMTVSQIAAKLGFGSADHFSRTFKHLVGISPSEFRKQDFRL